MLLIGSIILCGWNPGRNRIRRPRGPFIPLIVVSGGLPQSVLERFPHLKGATAFRISPDSCAQILELLQLNVSGIIGPALGGVLLYFLGANWVFAVNALCFVVVILALLQWKGPEAESAFPLENFLESFSAAVRYVRYSPAIQVVLARNVVFAFFISVIPALIPVIGLKELHLRPCSLGLLFTSMGAGSVFSAVFVLPRARERLS